MNIYCIKAKKPHAVWQLCYFIASGCGLYDFRNPISMVHGFGGIWFYYSLSMSYSSCYHNVYITFFSPLTSMVKKMQPQCGFLFVQL